MLGHILRYIQYNTCLQYTCFRAQMKFIYKVLNTSNLNNRKLMRFYVCNYKYYIKYNIFYCARYFSDTIFNI